MPLYLISSVCDDGVDENSFRLVEAESALAVAQDMLDNPFTWEPLLQNTELWWSLTRYELNHIRSNNIQLGCGEYLSILRTQAKCAGAADYLSELRMGSSCGATRSMLRWEKQHPLNERRLLGAHLAVIAKTTARVLPV